MRFSPELVQVPAIPTAVIRRQVSQRELSRVVPECCGRVWQVLQGQGVRGGRNVALYLDGSVRVEAGVECLVPFTEGDGVERSALPAGQAVTVAHLGSYGGLASAHHALLEWCEARGYEPTGPSWEIYGHWQSAWDQDSSQVRTDIYYQVTGQRPLR